MNVHPSNIIQTFLQVFKSYIANLTLPNIVGSVKVTSESQIQRAAEIHRKITDIEAAASSCTVEGVLLKFYVCANYLIKEL